MKKLTIILVIIAFSTMLQAQTETVKIFKVMLPKEVTKPTPLTDNVALEIWNKMKTYPSPSAFWKSGTGYNYSDVKKTFLDAKEIFRTFILPFTNGTLYKGKIQTDTDIDGLPVFTNIYWDAQKEKLAFRDFWRKEYADKYVLDIVRIYLDYDSSALN